MHILEILKSGSFVSGEDMARSLKISRAAVHKQISRLRKSGYEIDGAQNLGYKLVSRPDLVTSEEIKYYLKKNSVTEHSLFYFQETSSTQDEAKKIADSDIQPGICNRREDRDERGREFLDSKSESDAGTSVELFEEEKIRYRSSNPSSYCRSRVKFPALAIAEKQTGSYGRRRKSWFSNEGGLWFSLVLKPEIEPDSIPQITFVASLAVCRAVEISLGLNPQIKWPNDVMLNEKKFTGILTEMSAEVGKLNWVIVGIGINVNNPIPDPLKDIAISLSEVFGEKINRAEFLSTVLSEFYGLYDLFLEKGFAGFQKEYNRKSMLIGADVSIDTGDGVIAGVAQKIDSDGYLWLKTKGDKVIKIMAGDVIKVAKTSS